MKKGSLISLFLLIQIGVIAQTNWYVNQQSGSNSNNGQTPSTAFKTVEYAVNASNGFVQPW